MIRIEALLPGMTVRLIVRLEILERKGVGNQCHS